jgi:hypothetical protein
MMTASSPRFGLSRKATQAPKPGVAPQRTSAQSLLAQRGRTSALPAQCADTWFEMNPNSALASRNAKPCVGPYRAGVGAALRLGYHIHPSVTLEGMGGGGLEGYTTGGRARDMKLRIEPATYMQLTTGIDWITRSDVTLLTTLGYAQRLSANHVEVLNEGTLSRGQHASLGRYGDDLYAAVALGYSF